MLAQTENDWRLAECNTQTRPLAGAMRACFGPSLYNNQPVIVQMRVSTLPCSTEKERVFNGGLAPRLAGIGGSVGHVPPKWG